ncbi:MAG: Transcriptional regulator, AcrR family [uncultured Arthrobacter sp.]|uniref:Transcriptional regulator, AcrR family n=1 Tax=uncultured Arthrobacter sp. TaxID=114050 RepID=A0A6J4HQG6_9MICC|nr:TetR/AcrR family transcriptional regulator [uncultured Arthrobacter sp.]CAA9230455.1 MAG: Transcriptional regulator, AcrR family [uncultured Arthrobacter sp.]
MGRKSDARERILEASTALFQQRAYASIGVAEICSAAGVPKGSFYYFFPSKQALALEVINAHWIKQGAQWSGILTSSEPALDRLRKLFLATAEVQTTALKGTGSVTGCLFGNLALEVSAQDNPVRERLQQIFEEQIDLIEAAVREGAAAGEFAGVDPRGTAKSIVAQIEGMVLFAKLFNDPGQLDALWQNSLSLLGLQPAPAT